MTRSVSYSLSASCRRFQCNVCGMLNDVPIEYFSPLDHDGVRQDIASRPELNGGSVEYIAPKEYMVSTHALIFC